MPIYEYECPRCGRFEVIQKVSDRPLRSKPGCAFPDCPNAARRLISACSFELKGSGWYKTDYASSGGNGASKRPAKEKEAVSSGKSPSGCGASCDVSASAADKSAART